MPTEMCPVTRSNMVWGGSYPLDEHSVLHPVLDLHCPQSVWDECRKCPMTGKQAAKFTVDWLLDVRSRLGEPPISHHAMCPPICFVLCDRDAAEGKLQFYLDCSVIVEDYDRQAVYGIGYDSAEVLNSIAILCREPPCLCDHRDW